MTETRDHGGGLDAAIARYGGDRADWLDLSTGINPDPYPIGNVPASAWAELPDQTAQDALIGAARAFWNVPDSAQILAAPGASALIAKMPALVDGDGAYIPTPTYNEHAAAFRSSGRPVSDTDHNLPVHIHVHPNNPDGRFWDGTQTARSLTVIDESFCDVIPDASQIARAAEDGFVVLKSFGKFWGLAGLRLGFAIGTERTLAPMRDMLGPWAVSGPALHIGARALGDEVWAYETRARLAKDAAHLDELMGSHGIFVGGTDLFRLYDVGDAIAFQDRLAKGHIWSRVFPYSDSWVRLGLPRHDRWAQLEDCL